MGRLKTSKTSGLVALAALALQFFVSFGHVHFDHVSRANPALIVGLDARTAQSQPAQQPGDDGDDYCAICANIFLASSTFMPVAPQLPVPAVATAVEHVDRTAPIFVALHRLSFQSRAPPLA